jgi:hypothetical protein
MWGWTGMFSQPAHTLDPTTAYIHETGLFAAWWQYDNGHGETYRLTCSHIHQNRRQAEDCGRSTNAAIDRIIREHKKVDPNYVALRLARHDHQYLGVLKEEEIL